MALKAVEEALGEGTGVAVVATAEMVTAEERTVVRAGNPTRNLRAGTAACRSQQWSWVRRPPCCSLQGSPGRLRWLRADQPSPARGEACAQATWLRLTSG